MIARLVPAWARGYQREWLRYDLIAGLIIWSVVTPQAVAYAQIAGLPPESGLIAAPVAMLAYALVGTSHQLVVSATTATSAVSLATVGPLAGGDPAKFAALSAMLALVTGVVLVAGGWLRFGAVADLVSKAVMTGFLFGLGLTIMLAQLPSVLGVDAGDGDFFPQLRDLVEALGDIDGATLAVGAGSHRPAAGGQAAAPGRALDADRAGRVHRAVRAAEPEGPWRGRGGRHPAGAARPRRARRSAPRTSWPCSRRPSACSSSAPRRSGSRARWPRSTATAWTPIATWWPWAPPTWRAA